MASVVSVGERGHEQARAWVGVGVGEARAGRAAVDRAAGATASARTVEKHTKCVGLSKSAQ